MITQQSAKHNAFKKLYSKFEMFFVTVLSVHRETCSSDVDNCFKLSFLTIAYPDSN